jgi:hypothetical protein
VAVWQRLSRVVQYAPGLSALASGLGGPLVRVLGQGAAASGAAVASVLARCRSLRHAHAHGDRGSPEGEADEESARAINLRKSGYAAEVNSNTPAFNYSIIYLYLFYIYLYFILY